MSVMDDMLASMLMKMVPPEVLAALSPEKLQEYSDQVKALLAHFQNELDLIKSSQMQLDDKIDAVLERLGNERCNYTGGRKPKPVGNDSGSGSGSN